jgi:hypothetical protein
MNNNVLEQKMRKGEKIKYNNFLLFILTSLFLKLALDFSYLNLIIDPYSFIGFDYESSWFEVILSYLAVFTLFCLSYKKTITPSYYFVVLLLVTIYVPFSTLYAFSSFSSMFYYQVTFLFFILVLIQKTKRVKVPVLNAPRWALDCFLVILVLITLSFIFYSFYKMGFRLNYDLKLLYQVRAVFHDTIANGLLGYLFTLTTKSILIFFMGFSLFKKKYFYFLFFMACEVFIAGMANHKAIFLYPFLVLFIYLILLKRISPASIIFLFLSIVLIGNLFSFFGYDRFSIIFILRMFFMTVLNDYQYYIFFQDNPFTYFSNSFFGNFIEYPYKESIPEIIGYGRWSEDVAAFANTGIFGSGYMHMGFIGMLFFTLILSVIFKFVDSISVRINKGYLLVIPILIIPVRSVNSADLGSLLISHGLLLSLVLLFIYIKRERFRWNEGVR